VIARGIDIDPNMLDLARRYYAGSGAASETFVAGDAAHMQFDDASFDFSSVSLALHDKDFTLADAIVGEMKRVTRAGGYVVFMDFSAPLPASLTGFLVRVIERMAGTEHYRNFRGFLKTGGLTRVLEKNGLTMLKSTRVADGNIMLVLAQNSG
jgi:ubiquinone/menaquinone biosynthesis C-methylase UbiE